jgi:Flp pilus assembly protein TadD
MGKSHAGRTERIFVRWLVRIFAAAVLLGLLSWGGVYAFHKWQERHLVRRAAGYLSGGDLRIASLTARRAYQLNPENPHAARMLAEIAEKAGDGTELGWRRKVLELQPQSIDDALALVRCALRANDLPTAERTLQGLGEIAQQTPAYHAALGRLAEIRNNRAEAETRWRRAVELAPQEPAYQTQLAMLQLGSVDEAKRTAARAALEGLRSDPEQRTAATRALIIDGASRREDPQRLRALAADLQSYPEAAFSDRLLYAEILRQLKDPGYEEYRATLQKDAPADPGHLASFLSWMTTNREDGIAISYANTLPPETLSKWPVPLALAEAYAKANDWSGLQRLAAEKEWGGFDFLRHAWLARALRAEQKETAAGQEWARAQKGASAQPQALLMLARTVSAWGWERETIELLWSLSKAHETRAEALQLLYQHYAKTGDTGGVYRVLSRRLEIAPDNVTMQNNLAQVSLLLDAEPERARKLAAEVARKEPGNPAFVSTYAFSLYKQGDVGGAVEALRPFSEEQLQAPSIAAYYGIILAAAGEKEKARAYLERARQVYLLPEEKALLEKAESSIR